MKNIKCEKIMDEYLLLDKDSRLPLHLSLHLLSCPQCRSQVRLLTRAEHLAAFPLCTPALETDITIASVLKKIDAMKNTSVPNPISLKRWVVSGVLMVILMLSFFIFLAWLSPALKIAFCIVFALIITIYSALFIDSNIDFFIKKINTRDFIVPTPSF